MIIALLTALIATGALVWRELDARPIASVRIAGEFVNVSRESLQGVINGFLPSGFLRLDVEAVREAAAGLPWVRRVSVRRVWPDSLHVAVVERVAVARWNDGAYLEADATGFMPAGKTLDESLPRLSGPDGAESKVLERYQALVQFLAPLETTVRSVSLDRRGSWRVALATGLVLELGRAENLETIAPYLASLREILGRRYADAAQVDVRYQNGFAVKWRAPVAPEKGQSQ